jgi:hypothetical protein
MQRGVGYDLTMAKAGYDPVSAAFERAAREVRPSRQPDAMVAAPSLEPRWLHRLVGALMRLLGRW